MRSPGCASSAARPSPPASSSPISCPNPYSSSHSSRCFPFCTWIMIGYFSSIPKELDEAAMIDGASHLQMLWKIFIPVALPGIIAATIFAFTVSWAEFVYPMAFLYSSDQQVLTVGTVTSLIRADVYKWGMLMAGALTAAAPPLVIYAFLMDYYIAGLTAGATKG